MAGVGIDIWKWKDIEELSEVSLTNQPQEENHELYNQMYQLYLALYQHLKEDFRYLYQKEDKIKKS